MGLGEFETDFKPQFNWEDLEVPDEDEVGESKTAQVLRLFDFKGQKAVCFGKP